MSLKTTIEQDIKDAMRSKDQAALRALRAIKSAILLAETAEGHTSADLSEDEEMKLLTKQAKQRKDSLAQFLASNRNDLAEKEQEELAIIERYLPKPFTTEELTAAIKNIVAEVGATSIKDMGKVMGLASKQLAGKADGKAISEVVKQILN
ncbi:MAG: GatB/YqeY domain-containing protein [Bacteroidia bacterium]